MIRKYFTLLLTAAALPLFGQQATALPPNIRAEYTIERLTDSNGLGTNEMMFGIPIPEGKVIGDTYLDTIWRKSALLLYNRDQPIYGYEVRYNIQTNELDIKTSAGIKVMNGNNVKSFAWVDASKKDPVLFINAKEYRFNETESRGFFEILADGTTPLFKKVMINVKQADYNAALSMGSRDAKVLKKSSYFAGDGHRVTLLSNNKKKLLMVFGSNAEKVSAFIDQHGLSVKKEADLIRVFEYYNSLVTSPKS